MIYSKIAQNRKAIKKENNHNDFTLPAITIATSVFINFFFDLIDRFIK